MSYIEREAALDAIKSAFFDQRCDCEIMPDVFKRVQEVEAADVAPVVRCRECKFYREFRTKRYNQLMRLCYRMGKHDMEYPVKADDFCSYGQRKEAAHD